MNNNICDYPNPQFQRENFVLLNGEWDFGFEPGVRKYKFMTCDKELLAFHQGAECKYKINVPFCIESELSGIGYTDFVNRVWYKRTVNINKEKDKRVFLHIGAADYATTIIINGKIAAKHKGGYTPISVDITDFSVSGDNSVFVLCEDDTKNPLIPSGKQSDRKSSYACSYTRTTGIWQSVYLEYVPQNYIKDFKIYPDLKQKNVTIQFSLSGKASLKCDVLYKDKIVSHNETENADGSVFLCLSLSEIHLWELGNGELYSLEFTFGYDKVKSYFGLRSVKLDGYKFLLNEKSTFQRLVLDQGYYRKGIYTAENDEELKRDISLSMNLGFNGARLHQKVFDPRFLYFCDTMGYMVWGEYASWGIDYSDPKAIDTFLSEWHEVIKRDFNHPSIIGWCPFNETWNYHNRHQYDPLLSTVYEFTKSIDPTRPCIDTSGNFHIITDIYDVHDYRYNVNEFRESYNKLMTDGELYEHVLNDNKGRQKYNGEPVFVSEYGGIKWETDKEYKSWGYGKDVTSKDEFAERYCGLTEALIDNDKMLGLCYTQLYDVEQEQNGLFTYDREKKFSDDVYDKIRTVNTKKAAIE